MRPNKPWSNGQQATEKLYGLAVVAGVDLLEAEMSAGGA